MPRPDIFLLTPCYACTCLNSVRTVQWHRGFLFCGSALATFSIGTTSGSFYERHQSRKAHGLCHWLLDQCGAAANYSYSHLQLARKKHSVLWTEGSCHCIYGLQHTFPKLPQRPFQELERRRNHQMCITQLFHINRLQYDLVIIWWNNHSTYLCCML